jgi:hypothetical protein
VTGAGPAPAGGPDTGVRYRRLADVLDRRVLDGLLVLPRHHDGVVALLGAASALWELLSEPASEAELTATLQARYDADGAEIAEGVADALGTLLDLGLVTPFDPTTASGAHPPAPA